MSIVGEDQTLPILVQRDETEQVKFTHPESSGTNCLHSLLELYKDQVDLLKKELNHKNDIFTDLIQIVKERHNTFAIDNEICESVAKSSRESRVRPQFWSPNKGSFVFKHLCKYCIVLKHLCKYCIVLDTQRSDDV